MSRLFTGVTSLKACNFIKKETATQVFYSEYHKIYKKSFFYGTPPVTASEKSQRSSSSRTGKTLPLWKTKEVKVAVNRKKGTEGDNNILFNSL